MSSARHRNIRRKIKEIAIGIVALLTMTVPMLSTSATADGFLVTNLVSDLSGLANNLDPNLVNPWGIATSSGSPFWVSDNNAGVATLYNTDGSNVLRLPRVSIPNPVDICDAVGTPTGTVFNIDGGKTGGFIITNGTVSASAVFLFATEDGTIVGWNPGVNPDACVTQAGNSITGIIAIDNSGNNLTNPDPASQTGAVYKGLAIATDSSGRTLLYGKAGCEQA